MKYDQAFHTYAVEWFPDGVIRWFYDGRQVFEINKGSDPRAPLPPRDRMIIVLNTVRIRGPESRKRFAYKPDPGITQALVLYPVTEPPHTSDSHAPFTGVGVVDRPAFAAPGHRRRVHFPLYRLDSCLDPGLVAETTR